VLRIQLTALKIVQGTEELAAGIAEHWS